MARLNRAAAAKAAAAVAPNSGMPLGAVTVTQDDIATVTVGKPDVTPEATKPPAQVVGVEGFSPFSSGPSPDSVRASRDEIARLPKLPPFQMFIEEQWEKDPALPSDKFAVERAKARITQIGAEQFLAEYEAWHAQKGLWPHETPYGRAR